MPQDLTTITLDERNILRYHATVLQERDAAITDILLENTFRLQSGLSPPLSLHLELEESTLVFTLSAPQTPEPEKFRLSLQDLRHIIKDYFRICDAYYHALQEQIHVRLESIDMGRRGVHNEGSEKLQELLKPHVEIDFKTARRLFTLICVLHIRGNHHVLA